MRNKNLLISGLIFLVTLSVYFIFCNKTYETLNYFLPLANSMVHGKLDINCLLPLNELVEVNGRCFVVYPPMPAIALIPVAVLFGEKISQVYPGIIFAALAGGFFFLFMSRITTAKSALVASALFLFGTNFFLTSMLGRSWYFAHILAVMFLSLGLYFSASKKPFLSGLFLAFAGLSRLPVFLAFPALLYFLKPKKRDFLVFFIPIVCAVILFGFYNFARFGSFVQTGYSLIPGVLEEPWFQEGIFSLGYIPRNLKAVFLFMPNFSQNFPFFLPNTFGMALWLTTPALLGLFFVYKSKRSLAMLGISLLVLIPSLLHGTVGFSQFGYRFSLDAILLLIIALLPLIEKKSRIVYGLIVLSILINLYAVILFYLGLFRP